MGLGFVDLLEPALLVLQFHVSLVEIILSLHELIVLVMMIGINVSLFALIELEVFLRIFDHF